MKHRAAFALICSAILFQGPALAQNAAPDQLQRRGTIGLGLQARPDTMAVVGAIRPGGPADKAGLKIGDQILLFDGKTVGSQAELGELLRTLPGGKVIDVQIKRAGAEQTIAVTLDTTAEEKIEGSAVSYSSVTVPAGYKLRTIISTPTASPLAKDGKVPALLYVQGIFCASLDRPQAPDAVDTRLVHSIAKAGYVTLRVDKPGLGDSQGPACGEIDFNTELEGFKAALKQLASLPNVDPERIYIFGHSMGGVMAPYLTKEAPVRGTIVYGTLARTWFEYQLENTRRQMELSGQSQSAISEAVQAEAKTSSMILVDKKTMGDVWKRYPELKSEGPMVDETHLSSRHMSFYHQLQDLNLAKAWEESVGHLLAIHGEYDWVTTGPDHDLLAKIVNAKTAGAATSISLPKADHAFTLHDSLEASLPALGQGRFDTSLPTVVLNWIQQVEGNAPKGDLVPKPKQAAEAAPESPTIAKAGGTPAAAAADAGKLPEWRILTTERYPGKQDDIFFVNPTTGWYVNGAGKIFKTIDGGETWAQKVNKPGTYFRCIAFVDEKVGFAGNIGPGYFPNVTDETPLYRTEDGGETWTPVTTIDGPKVVGLCALEVVREQFVNAGNLDIRVRIVGVGRVGGPVAMISSDDLGETWKQTDIKDHTAMAFDVHFFDQNHGVIAGATDTDVTQSRARIITTADGGKTWTTAYESSRPYELTWKISFPTRDVGYVTIQSYNPDPSASQRFVAKTTDGGKTWSEIPLIDDAKVRQFGVAFIDENRGWIGAMPNGFQTIDGGKTWNPTNFGNAVNKIRILRTPAQVNAYSIGVQVAKTSLAEPSPAK
jgi:photosystem II stability/assembly factor-like uncharacterized protein/dienelactone hydrolase